MEFIENLLVTQDYFQLYWVSIEVYTSLFVVSDSLMFLLESAEGSFPSVIDVFYKIEQSALFRSQLRVSLALDWCEWTGSLFCMMRQFSDGFSGIDVPFPLAGILGEQHVQMHLCCMLIKIGLFQGCSTKLIEIGKLKVHGTSKSRTLHTFIKVKWISYIYWIVYLFYFLDFMVGFSQKWVIFFVKFKFGSV